MRSIAVIVIIVQKPYLTGCRTVLGNLFKIMKQLLSQALRNKQLGYFSRSCEETIFVFGIVMYPFNKYYSTENAVGLQDNQLLFPNRFIRNKNPNQHTCSVITESKINH